MGPIPKGEKSACSAARPLRQDFGFHFGEILKKGFHLGRRDQIIDQVGLKYFTHLILNFL